MIILTFVGTARVCRRRCVCLLAPAKVVWPPHNSSSEPVPKNPIESTPYCQEAPIQAAAQSYISETRVSSRTLASAQTPSTSSAIMHPNLSKKFSVCSQEVSSITEHENLAFLSEVVSSDRPRSPTPTKAATAVDEAPEEKRDMPPPPPPITSTPILSTAIQPIAVPACDLPLVPRNPQAPYAIQLPCGNSIQGTINLQLVPVNTVTGQTVCNLQLVPVIQNVGNLPTVDYTNPNPKNNPQTSNPKQICEACPEKSCLEKSYPKENPPPKLHPKPYPPPRTETHTEIDYSHELANISENKLLIEMNKPISCYLESGKPIEIDSKLLERCHTPKHLAQSLPKSISNNTGSSVVFALTTASERPYSLLGTFQSIENFEAARETLSPVLAARVRRSSVSPVLATGRAEQMVQWEKQAKRTEALAKPVAKMNLVSALTTSPDKPYAPLTNGGGAFRPVSGKYNLASSQQHQQQKQLPPAQSSSSNIKLSGRGSKTPTIRISEAFKSSESVQQSTSSKIKHTKTEAELLHSSQISLETRCLSPRVLPSRPTPSNVSQMTGLHKPATIPIYQQSMGDIPVGRPTTPKCPMIDSPRVKSPASVYVVETTTKQHLSKEQIQAMQQSSYHHQVEVAHLPHRPVSGLKESIQYPVRDQEKPISQSAAQPLPIEFINKQQIPAQPRPIECINKQQIPAQLRPIESMNNAAPTHMLNTTKQQQNLSKDQIQSMQQSSYHHQVEFVHHPYRVGSGLGEPIQPQYSIKDQEQNLSISNQYSGQKIKTSKMNIQKEQKQSHLQYSKKEETISSSGNERKVSRRHVTEKFERNTNSMIAEIRHLEGSTAQQKSPAIQIKTLSQGFASLNEKKNREPAPQRRLVDSAPSFDSKEVPPKEFGEVIQPVLISTPKTFSQQQQQSLSQQTQIKNTTKFQPVKPSPLATGPRAAPASIIPKSTAIHPTSLPDPTKASPLKHFPSTPKTSSLSSAPKNVVVTNPPGPLPDAGAGGKSGAAFAGATAPKRGRGVLNQPGMAGVRIALCGHCNVQIR